MVTGVAASEDPEHPCRSRPTAFPGFENDALAEMSIGFHVVRRPQPAATDSSGISHFPYVRQSQIKV
ncbi:MAG: hypothetical protein Fues2KO_11980 [Fuerstiella sp.]